MCAEHAQESEREGFGLRFLMWLDLTDKTRGRGPGIYLKATFANGDTATGEANQTPPPKKKDKRKKKEKKTKHPGEVTEQGYGLLLLPVEGASEHCFIRAGIFHPAQLDKASPGDHLPCLKRLMKKERATLL